MLFSHGTSGPTPHQTLNLVVTLHNVSFKCTTRARKKRIVAAAAAAALWPRRQHLYCSQQEVWILTDRRTQG